MKLYEEFKLFEGMWDTLDKSDFRESSEAFNINALQLVTDGPSNDPENSCVKQSFDVCTNKGVYLATIAVIYDSYNDCPEVYSIEPDFDNDLLNQALNTNGYINAGREFARCIDTKTMGDVVLELIKEELSKNPLTEDAEITYNMLDPEYTDWRYNQPRKTYIKTFGSKKYDLANPGQLHDWVEANVQFQMKRYPNRYAHKNPEPGEYTPGESNTTTLRLTVLRNLLKQLEAEKADDRICMSIYDEIRWLEGQHVGKQLDNKAREQIKDLLVNDALEAFVNACNKNMYHLTDEDKAKAKEQFTTACYNILFNK
jgi:hypothetical protein